MYHHHHHHHQQQQQQQQPPGTLVPLQTAMPPGLGCCRSQPAELWEQPASTAAPTHKAAVLGESYQQRCPNGISLGKMRSRWSWLRLDLRTFWQNSPVVGCKLYPIKVLRWVSHRYLQGDAAAPRGKHRDQLSDSRGDRSSTSCLKRGRLRPRQ